MKTCGKGHEYTTLRCNACAAIRAKKYRDSNPEKVRIAVENWRSKNKEHIKDYDAARRVTNAAQRSDARKAYYAKNKAAELAYRKEYALNNPGKIKAAQDKYTVANADARKASVRGWKKRNPESGAALKAKRRAAKLQQTPPWYTHTDCVAIYKELKPGYHLDHIIPLQGENVSGLHWHHNLQLLPAAENMSKGNKFDSDTYVHELPFY